VEKYHGKLAAGYKATGPFIPPAIQTESRDKLVTRLSNTIRSLNAHLNGFTESQLDMLLLPHPLLGKLTLREMLYFTIYHVEHHEKQVLENLQKRVS
jgi:hypothetical protein